MVCALEREKDGCIGEIRTKQGILLSCWSTIDAHISHTLMPRCINCVSKNPKWHTHTYTHTDDSGMHIGFVPPIEQFTNQSINQPPQLPRDLHPWTSLSPWLRKQAGYLWNFSLMERSGILADQGPPWRSWEWAVETLQKVRSINALRACGACMCFEVDDESVRGHWARMSKSCCCPFVNVWFSIYLCWYVYCCDLMCGWVYALFPCCVHMSANANRVK